MVYQYHGESTGRREQLTMNKDAQSKRFHSKRENRGQDEIKEKTVKDFTSNVDTIICSYW